MSSIALLVTLIIFFHISTNVTIMYSDIFEPYKQVDIVDWNSKAAGLCVCVECGRE